MNGDNPMQSEFSSHIGMTGKCFCRVCNVAKSRGDGDSDSTEKQRIEDFMSVRVLTIVRYLLGDELCRPVPLALRAALSRPLNANFRKFCVVHRVQLRRSQPQPTSRTVTFSISRRRFHRPARTSKKLKSTIPRFKVPNTLSICSSSFARIFLMKCGVRLCDWKVGAHVLLS